MAGIKVKMRVEGLREMAEDLKELPKATGRNVLRRALSDSAEPVVADARSRAPVAAGTLKSSHTVGTKLSKRQRAVHRQWAGTAAVRTPNGWRSQPAKAVYVFGGPGPLPQATLQEWGTADQPPQPYLRPAWDAGKRRSVQTFMQAMSKHLEAARQRMARKAARLLKKGRRP